MQVNSASGYGRATSVVVIVPPFGEEVYLPVLVGLLL